MVIISKLKHAPTVIYSHIFLGAWFTNIEARRLFRKSARKRVHKDELNNHARINKKRVLQSAYFS